MRRQRNALMASMYGDDDPGEIPPEGFIEGEDGPPDQYVPLDEMSRNALMPNVHLAGVGAGGGRRATRSNNAFEVEQYLRGLAQTPQGSTDAGIQEIMGLAHQYGVRSPFDRAFNDPPSARGGPVGPMGRPRPLMRGPDEYKDERGGRGSFWDDNDPSVYEPEYQSRYGRR